MLCFFQKQIVKIMLAIEDDQNLRKSQKSEFQMGIFLTASMQSKLSHTRKRRKRWCMHRPTNILDYSEKKCTKYNTLNIIGSTDGAWK